MCICVSVLILFLGLSFYCVLLYIYFGIFRSVDMYVHFCGCHLMTSINN